MRLHHEKQPDSKHHLVVTESILAAACQVICRPMYRTAYEKQADACPPFSYVLPELVFTTKRKLC
jgi:hypothetical protein